MDFISLTVVVAWDTAADCWLAPAACWVAAAMVYVQIVVGAWLRHSGLMVPFFLHLVLVPRHAERRAAGQVDLCQHCRHAWPARASRLRRGTGGEGPVRRLKESRTL